MSLNPGTKIPRADGTDGYVNSMAQAMEEAFKQEWPYVMKGADTPAANDQMRLMFIAVARGVVKHLKDNHESFKVTVASNGIGDVSSVDAV